MKRFAFIAAALLVSMQALAQAVPTVTFGASVTNANGSLSTKLTWDTQPAASSCTASGNPSWTGSKAVSGSLDLPPISLSGTYSLTLSCTWNGDTQATLTWTQPTQNTDGTSLAKCAAQTSTGPCLLSFKAYHGTSATALTDVRSINDRNATTYQFTGLATGTHYFSISAVNGDGVESAKSAVGSKVVTGSVVKQSGVTLTVNPIPGVPGDFTVQ